jgi:thioredoxin 1
MSQKTLYYFTATWCGPCKRIKPTYEKMKHDFDSINFVMVDVDQDVQTTQKFSISSMPTFVALNGEEEVERFSGASEERLINLVDKLNNL